MKKIICFVRVSTDTQSYDAQLKELVNYAKSSGYKDEEIMIIEGAGASAIKINDLYKDNQFCLTRLYVSFTADKPNQSAIAKSWQNVNFSSCGYDFLHQSSIPAA